MPLHQTTPSTNPLTMGPPPLHWLGAVWWCFGHGVVLPLPSVFVFFLSYAVSTIATQLCLVLLLHFFCPCSFFMENHMGSLGLPPPFASSWAHRSNCCYFLLGCPVSPYFSLFFHLCLFSLYVQVRFIKTMQEMGDVSNNTSV